MGRVQSQRFNVEVEFGLLDDLNDVLEHYFSDSDFDRDGFLSSVHAELSVLIDKIKKQRGMI
tara:strand:- start:1419 stop:1604 length:186 start_codon:yes stop_codon:yes gene_type:complete